MPTLCNRFDRPIVRAAIWGFGREGAAARAFLAREAPDAEVTIIDQRDVRGVDGVSPLDRLMDEDAADLRDQDLVIRSAGVRWDKPALAAARNADVDVTTGAALWMRRADPARVVGVTGTKGKSTTGALISALLNAAGVDAVFAGNIGAPLLGLPAPAQGRVVVAEISSYQAVDMDVGPSVMALTSLFREHLDWHGDYAAYAGAKRVPFASAQCRHSLVAAAAADAARAAQWPAFETVAPAMARDGLPKALQTSEGLSNLGLSICAAEKALGENLSADTIDRALSDWSPPPHRREELGWIDGKLWVDDALATIPEATVAALAAYPERPIVTILGGKDRGQILTPLQSALAARADVRLVLTGETRMRFSEALGDYVADSLSELEAAIRRAAALCPEGGVVLFSPSAASDPPYASFEERAAVFRTLARARHV